MRWLARLSYDCQQARRRRLSPATGHGVLLGAGAWLAAPPPDALRFGLMLFVLVASGGHASRRTGLGQ
jgi:hypothetical protein